MENSQPLATDSFSYSWLINNKPSFDSLLESLRPSLEFSGNDYETIPIQFFKDDFDFDSDFNFNAHPGSSRFSISLVPADEIFSDGCIQPVFATSATPASSVAAGPEISGRRNNQDYSVRKCKTGSSGKKVWRRCYGLLIKPICRRLGCSRTSVRVDDLDRKALEVRSLCNSVQASPERSINWGADLRKSRSLACEVSPAGSPSYNYSSDASESSIHEAILHCKKSFGMH